MRRLMVLLVGIFCWMGLVASADIPQEITKSDHFIIYAREDPAG